jgi:hypothetical protein
MAEVEQQRAARKPRRGSKKGADRAARAMMAMRPPCLDVETGVLPLACGYFALRDSAAPKRRARR